MKLLLRRIVLAVSSTLVLCLSQLSYAEPFIGEVAWVPYNFAPRGWASCDGQILSISQNTALFSLLGTTYGGDGRTTFGLPDVRSRTLMHQGNGPGLTSRSLGEKAGEEAVTITTAQMPAHNHGLSGSTALPSSTSPTNNVLATQSRSRLYAETANTQMDIDSVGYAGGNQAHENMQPYTVLHCIIALQGIFPSRN